VEVYLFLNVFNYDNYCLSGERLPLLIEGESEKGRQLGKN